MNIYPESSIALLHLDVDLYLSYKVVLEKFYCKVTKGGIILFDEYLGGLDYLKFPGAYKAISEFLGDKIKKIKKDPDTGKFFIIKDE